MAKEIAEGANIKRRGPHFFANALGTTRCTH
jgi:hypothetical protein